MTPKAGGSPGRGGGVKKYIMLKNAGVFFFGGEGGSLFLVPRGRAR